MRFGEKTTIISGAAYIAIGSLLVLVNLGWYIPISRILAENIKDEEQNAAEKSTIAVTTFLDLRRSNLEVIARALSDDLPDMRNQDLIAGLLREKSFNRVFLSDNDGSEMFVTDRARTVLPEEYGTVRGTDEFIRAISGQAAFGRVRITDRFEPVLTIAVPVMSSAGKVIGVLGAELSAKSVFEFIGTITIDGRGVAYVVDDTGVLIAHEDVSLVLKNTNFANRLVVQETLRTGANESSLGKVYVYENENGVSVRGSGAYQENTRWAVIFEDPKNEAERPILIIRALLGVIVGIGLFAFFLLRRVNVNLGKTKNTLELERNQLDTIINSLGDGLFVIDRDMNVVLANTTAGDLLDISVSEMTGKHISEFATVLHGSTTITPDTSPIEKVLQSGVALHVAIEDNIVYWTKKGKELPVTMTITPLLGGKRAEDTISGAVIIFRDATSAKKTNEERKLRADELERLNSFMVGRELKMIELKDKIAALEKERGEKNAGE